MSRSSHLLSDDAAEYVRNVALPAEGEVLRKLRDRTAELPMSQMQISVEQGRLMALLTSLIGAKRAIEVGVFTGYSALCVAERLPNDGVLLACDVSEEWTSIAQEYWKEAGVSDRIDLRLAPATETLQGLVNSGESGTWDLAFIDADKGAYVDYYELCLTLLRPGGAILVDNMFMGGSALDPDTESESGRGVRRFYDHALGDERVDSSLLPIGDGVLLARKR